MAVRQPWTVVQSARRGSLTLRSESWGLSVQWTPASILNALACCPDRATVPTRPGTRAQLLASPGRAYLATPTGETLVCLGRGWHLACGHPQLVGLEAQRQPLKSPRSRSAPSDAHPPHRRPATRHLSPTPHRLPRKEKAHPGSDGGPSPAIRVKLTKLGNGGQKGPQKSVNGHQQTSGARPGHARGRNTPQQIAHSVTDPGATCYPACCPSPPPSTLEPPDQPVSCTRWPGQVVRTGCPQRAQGHRSQPRPKTPTDCSLCSEAPMPDTLHVQERLPERDPGAASENHWGSASQAAARSHPGRAEFQERRCQWEREAPGRRASGIR